MAKKTYSFKGSEKIVEKARKKAKELENKSLSLKVEELLEQYSKNKSKKINHETIRYRNKLSKGELRR